LTDVRIGLLFGCHKTVLPPTRGPAVTIRAMPDVIVVGGGVAGSATAIHLARRGREVLLLDRVEFPRRKPCGEGLFPRGVRELRGLGVLERLPEAMPIECLRFHGYGHTAEARLGSPESPALGISRAVLDSALLEQARRDGVAVRCGLKAAQLVDEGGAFDVVADSRYRAPVVVAADGLGSGLRLQAGIGVRRGTRYGISAHVELRSPAERVVDVYFRRGYEVYITPVGPRTANIAVLTSKPMTQTFAGDASAGLSQVLGADEVLAAGWRFIDEAMMAGPFPVRPRRLWSRNLVLCGDAAGFFDGITGEGMSLALASARDCAEAVDAFISTGDAKNFRRYEAKRLALARNSELLGRLTLLLSKRQWTARRAIRGLGRRPQAFSRLVGVSSGEAPMRNLRPWDLGAPLLG
jgi:flavin-dependent dehydrogenase